MVANPVGWFEIYVQDMERAKAFYEALFEVQLQKLESNLPEGGDALEMWAFPWEDDAPGAAGALARMEDCPSGGNSTLVYFNCADCAVQAARAETAGGKIFREKFPIGQYGFIALVCDTEGNMIGLHSME